MKPQIIVVFGPDGVGKSSFASGAPEAIFLGTEQGTNYLDVARFPTSKSWADVQTALNELQTKKHGYKTLVIDSLDWLEPLVHQAICKRHNAKSMATAAGGYGKGYVEALDEFIQFKDALNVLRDMKEMNIILIAHAQVVTFNDPENQTAYERFELKLHKLVSAMFREYADAVLFVSYQIYSSKDAATGKIKNFGDGQRIMYTERRPGFDAKNRMGLPFTLPLSPVPSESWAMLQEAIDKGEPESPDAIRARIEGMMHAVPADKVDTVNATIEKAANNVHMLMSIEARLNIITQEKLA